MNRYLCIADEKWFPERSLEEPVTHRTILDWMLIGTLIPTDHTQQNQIAFPYNYET